MRVSLAAAGAAAAVVAYRRRQPEDDLTGEVALVTGSSRGLGLLVAAELASFDVIVAAEDSGLVPAVEDLAATGAQVQPVRADLATFSRR